MNMSGLKMQTRLLPSSFIQNKNHEKYFKDQGGFKVLEEIKLVFGKPALNYIIHHTTILYDSRSLSRTAGGTCEQNSDVSIVRLRHNTTGSKAQSRWWHHVLRHELLHSLLTDISLSLKLSNDEPLAEGLPILLENLMASTPLPNEEDMAFTILTFEALKSLAKKRRITLRELVMDIVGSSKTVSSRKKWGQALSDEYRIVKNDIKRKDMFESDTNIKELYKNSISKFKKVVG